MALKIRLRQQGRTNRQTYRLVVTDVRHPRDGKYLEMLGWYNPFARDNNCQVHADRVRFWIGQGAKLTPNAAVLVKKIAPDVMHEIRQKDEGKRVKNAAKRRALKQAKKSSDGTQPVAKKAAPAAEEPKAAAKPKAPRAKKAKAAE